MSKHASFRGVFAYPVTPLKNDGDRIDEKRLRALIDEFLEAGVHGIVVVGSTGAVGSFSEEERRRLATVAARHIDGRVPLLLGTGANTTAETVRLSRHAESVGAAGLQLVPMSHWPLTEDEIYAHFRAVSDAVSIPIAVHNCPSLTGIDMKPALLARLTGIRNVCYLKEGAGDLARVPAIRRLTKGKVPVFQDSETTALQGLLAGAEVWATMMPNAFARACVRLYQLAAVEKDVDGARELFARMFPVIELVAAKSGIRALHTALELLGRPAGPPRRPMRMLARADRAELEKRLRACGDLVRWSRRRSS